MDVWLTMYRDTDEQVVMHSLQASLHTRLHSSVNPGAPARSRRQRGSKCERYGFDPSPAVKGGASEWQRQT